jgi:formylglycine-generating enzyme required for sulfatase activity
LPQQKKIRLPDQVLFISYPRGGLAHTWAETVHADLVDRGATVWRDEASIHEGDEDWLSAIDDALIAADGVVCITSHESEGCQWQKREILKADKLGLPLVVLRACRHELPLSLIERQPIEAEGRDPSVTLDALAAALASAVQPSVTATGTAASVAATARRQTELAFLKDLVAKSLSTHEARYVPVAAEQQRAPSLARSLPSVPMNTGAILQVFGQHDVGTTAAPTRNFTDALDAFRALPSQTVRRLAVLGEPGAGKSFSLERIACELARSALKDPSAPLPCLVRLGLWTREAEPLEAFLRRQLGTLGPHFDALLDEERVFLLLDGLNEIPPSQRRSKTDGIQSLAFDQRFAGVVVSCREREFRSEFGLPFDTLTLQPLSPIQILRFLEHLYALDAGPENGRRRAWERFWALAGADLEQVWHVWSAAGVPFEAFWQAEDIPPEARSRTSYEQDECWRRRTEPRRLLNLATNPFLLYILAILPQMPPHRAGLFDGFLKLLYRREREAYETRHDARSVPAEEIWLGALTACAEALQSSPLEDDEEGITATSLPRSRWPGTLTEEIVTFSRDASVLELAGDDLRFTHQLLQEALASRVLLQASRDTRPLASEFWARERWSHRNGWEVVAELAAEACATDPEALWALLSWLAKANPEVASEAWRHTGRPRLPTAFADAVRTDWAERLTDQTREPDAHARAAIGRALATFGLDTRRGIGVMPDGTPDIDWVTIPAGPFVYQGNPETLDAFRISRYPITVSQFRAFVDAPDGFAHDRWWTGYPYEARTTWQPEFPFDNHPCESVDWWQAMAFCRWLSERLGVRVALPTERQWERAAAGGGRKARTYPWGNQWDSSRVNAEHALGQTSAVGIYPRGASKGDGVHDLSGNVWEWTASLWDETDALDEDPNLPREVRGGSWYGSAGGCRAAFRFHLHPDSHYDLLGFRVVCCPIQVP